jgi:spore coat polysaccharide biosynthesis predicted glycosyltransferase SpsG
MTTAISVEFIERLTAISNWVAGGHINRHASLAVVLEDLATDIWLKAQELGETTWKEAEGLEESGSTEAKI